MTFLQTHRRWILWTLAAIFVGLTETIVFDMTEKNLLETQKIQKTETEILQKRVAQMNQDAQTAADLQTQITPQEVELVLSPTDRRGFAEKIESLSKDLKLQNMVYTLAPPRPFGPEKAKFPNAQTTTEDTIQSVTLSDLEIEGEAPTDREILQFLEMLHTPQSSERQGRLDFRLLEIETLNDSPPPASATGSSSPSTSRAAPTPPVEAYNLKFRARLAWLSNAALKKNAEKGDEHE